MIINIGNEDDLGVTLWTKSLDRGGLIHVKNVVFFIVRGDGVRISEVPSSSQRYLFRNIIKK